MDSSQTLINLPPKILIVEDSPIVQMAEKSLFESFGFEIDVAESGEKAIALFKPGKYTMVLLDLGLPDMTGHEVCKYLVKIEENTSFRTPMIGISASGSVEENDLCLEVGMKEMLYKPLLPGEAKALLKRHKILNPQIS